MKISFYRLNVIHLILPPLRDRREDISLLANHFLQKFSSENQRDIIDIDPMAMSLLTAWSWPGNIRELSNVIERAVVMNSGPIIFLRIFRHRFVSQSVMLAR